MRGPVILKANAATVWRELIMATSAAMLLAAPAEAAVAPDDPAAG